MLMRRRDFLAAGAGSLVAFHPPARVAAAPGPHQRLTAIHVMIETPAWAADPGGKFDPKKFLRQCREAQVEVIEFKTKNAVGEAGLRENTGPVKAALGKVCINTPMLDYLAAQAGGSPHKLDR